MSRRKMGAKDTGDETPPPAGTLERPLRGRSALDSAPSLSSGVPSEPCPLSRSNAQPVAGFRPQVFTLARIPVSIVGTGIL